MAICPYNGEPNRITTSAAEKLQLEPIRVPVGHGQRGDKGETNGDIGQKGMKVEEPKKSKIAKNISLCPCDVSRTGNATIL
jgi:hypothetical protein